MLTVFVYPILPVLLRNVSSFISCEFLPLNLIIAINRKIKDKTIAAPTITNLFLFSLLNIFVSNELDDPKL